VHSTPLRHDPIAVCRSELVHLAGLSRAWRVRRVRWAGAAKWDGALWFRSSGWRRAVPGRVQFESRMVRGAPPTNAEVSVHAVAPERRHVLGPFAVTHDLEDGLGTIIGAVIRTDMDRTLVATRFGLAIDERWIGPTRAEEAAEFMAGNAPRSCVDDDAWLVLVAYAARDSTP
jgi:hypothetical protein